MFFTAPNDVPLGIWSPCYHRCSQCSALHWA